MKRSEMIKLIKDYLTGITSLTDVDNELAASQLLHYIEQSGMTPPESQIPQKRELSPDQEITWFKTMRQWEKE